MTKENKSPKKWWTLWETWCPIQVNAVTKTSGTTCCIGTIQSAQIVTLNCTTLFKTRPAINSGFKAPALKSVNGCVLFPYQWKSSMCFKKKRKVSVSWTWANVTNLTSQVGEMGNKFMALVSIRHAHSSFKAFTVDAIKMSKAWFG